MSKLSEHTAREIVILSLVGLPGHTMPMPENRFVECFTERGVTRKQALPIVHDLIAQGLLVHEQPEELSGNLGRYLLTQTGVAEKEDIYARRLDEALEILGPLELRHEQMLKAADRCQYSGEVAGAWQTLHTGWNLLETVRELAGVELLSADRLENLEIFGQCQLGLSILGMKLITRNGWSQYAKAGEVAAS